MSFLNCLSQGTTTRREAKDHEAEYKVNIKNMTEFTDLTFKQFQVSKLNELLQKGYMLVNTDTYGEYLDIVGNVNKEKEKQH